MSLIAVAGGKSAAGVTATATALAAVWPRPAILADCEPSGGDVALRLRRADGAWLVRDRGLVGLAANARMEMGPLDVAGQVQVAIGGLQVLVGVESAGQALKMDGLWPAIGAALAAVPNLDVVADCGRLFPGLPSEHLLTRADRIVLVTRATAESVAHARHAVDYVRGLPIAGGSALLLVAVIAPSDTIDSDVAQVRTVLSSPGHDGLKVAGLAFDPVAAAGLSGVPTRGLDRSALVGDARRIAADLYAAPQDNAFPAAAGSPIVLTTVKAG